jgi:hypothetical protein
VIEPERRRSLLVISASSPRETAAHGVTCERQDAPTVFVGQLQLLPLALRFALLLEIIELAEPLVPLPLQCPGHGPVLRIDSLVAPLRQTQLFARKLQRLAVHLHNVFVLQNVVIGLHDAKENRADGCPVRELRRFDGKLAAEQERALTAHIPYACQAESQRDLAQPFGRRVQCKD